MVCKCCKLAFCNNNLATLTCGHAIVMQRLCSVLSHITLPSVSMSCVMIQINIMTSCHEHESWSLSSHINISNIEIMGNEKLRKGK